MAYGSKFLFPVTTVRFLSLLKYNIYYKYCKETLFYGWAL